MEQGNDQRNRVGGQASNRVSATAAYVLSRRRQRRPRKPGTRYTIHDNTSQGYGWLLQGWIAEERHMLSGRVYRYYYDPSGRLYYTQNEVIRAWEEKGLILLDK